MPNDCKYAAALLLKPTFKQGRVPDDVLSLYIGQELRGMGTLTINMAWLQEHVGITDDVYVIDILVDNERIFAIKVVP